MATSPKDVGEALAEAKALVAALESHDGTPANHLALLKRTDAVRASLEEPYDRATRWLESMTLAHAIYILIRIGAFQLLPPGEDATVSAAKLAELTNADVSIITRAMRVLVVNGIAVEVSTDEYRHNMMSHIFQPEALGCFVAVSVDMMKSLAHIPDYVAKHKPEDLYETTKSPYVFAAGQEGRTYYEVLNEDPKLRHLWNLTMQSMEKNFPIVGMFPFKDLESQVRSQPERPFIVDIGGGRGQALRAIKADLGGDGFGGKFILQDLPMVIETLKPEEVVGVEPMSYDIFTPQPVKNAHVYFMRRLLHDFYDPAVKQILSNTVSAMTADSRLVVCDMMIPERTSAGDDQVLYWLDLTLMTMSGRERRLEEFKNIFDEVGLELVQHYPSGQGHTTCFEGKLKKSS